MKQNMDKYFNKAFSYMENKKYKKALKLFLHISKLGNNSADLNIGYLYDKLGKRKKAKLYYKKYIKYTQDTSAMINLGIIYKEEYNFKKAKKWFKKALELNDGDAAFELAKIYLCEAKLNKAKKYLEIVINSNTSCESSIEDAKYFLFKLKKFKNEIC